MSGSDRFSFLTLHELIFLTHFFKGGSYVSNANCNSKHSPCVQASPRAARKLSYPALVSESWCDKDSLIFSPGVTFFVTFLCGRQKSRKKEWKTWYVQFLFGAKLSNAEGLITEYPCPPLLGPDQGRRGIPNTFYFSPTSLTDCPLRTLKSCLKRYSSS